MKRRWYDQTPEALAEQLNTNLQTGLSKKEVATRLKRYGKNNVYPISRAPFKTYLLHILTDFMAFLLLITAGISGVLRRDPSCLVIFAILFVNYGVTVVSYIKSQRVLEEMGRFSLPSAKVLRDGRIYLVKQEQLVQGDVIFVAAGDIIPCDARLVESDGLTVLETGVTQNEKPVIKDASFAEHRMLSPEGRKNMLFASTVVTEGKGKAVVCDTGEDTLVCILGKNTTICDHEKLEVTRTIRKYCSKINLFMILAVFLVTALRLFGVGYFSVFDTFLLMLALSVSDMTELVAAFSYIIIASGVFGAVKRYKDINVGALIKNSSKIGKLKNLNCLIIPKECLFSQQDMRVERLYAGGKICETQDSGGMDAERLLRYAVISTGIYGVQKLTVNNLNGENVYTPEEEALIHAAERRGIYDRSLDEGYPILDHAEKSDTNPFDITLVQHGVSYLAVLRGGAQSVLERCNRYSQNGRVYPMDPEARSRFSVAANHMMRGSNRIIGIGSKRFQYNSLKRLGQAQNDLIFEGFLCIEEPLVPGVAKCISRCKASGIRVILLCREESENNQALAVSMGIAQNASECISIEKIKTMKEDLLRANISIYSMYEGLHNGQQRYIMKWLREDYGYKIGVMGRELDDIALFGEADVAFSEVTTISDKAPRAGVDMSGKDTPLQVKNAKASGRIGCEAVKFVSDVIVSAPDKEGTGGFVSMVSAVENARNIYRNLLMMMRYLLCSQAARALFLVFSMLTGTLLLYPQQILFLGLISDMVAVIVIAFSGPSGETLSGGEDSEKKLSGLWLAGWKYTLLAVFFSISVLLQFPVYERAGTVLNASQKSTVIFFTLLISQFFLLTAMLFRKKGRMTDTRVNTSYLGMLLLLSLFIAALQLFPGFASLFSVTAFPPLCYAGISLSAVLALFLGLIGRVFRKNRTRKNDRRDKLFE